ncbi:MAG: enoyl-CoA hydratase-related protein [Pseudomonadota bacterium]
MTNLPKSDVLHTSVTRGWLTLTMDDPRTKNALSEEMARSLAAVLSAVEDDRTIRGITLRGANGVFCSGGDLKGMASKIAARDRDAIMAMSKAGGEMFAQLNEQPQFVFVQIDGPAMAGGLGLACCGDLVAVTPAAKFALTEAQLGIPPAQIAPYLVARLGLPTTRRLMLTAAKIDAEGALTIGLADHLVSTATEMERFEDQVISSVLSCAPGALAASKRVALEAASAPPRELSDDAATAFTDCLLSDEGAEGIASFIGKRKPRWADYD